MPIQKKQKTTRKRKKNYLNNKDLLAEVIACKGNQNTMSDKLAKMLTLLCARYASRPQYAGYTYNDDMQSYAIMQICKTWWKFKEDLSDNPFSYYTRCFERSFKQFLNQEKKHRNIRDELLLNVGMSPSHTYLTEYEQALQNGNDDSYSYDLVDNDSEMSDNSSDL